jgi:hypothetical protein
MRWTRLKAKLVALEKKTKTAAVANTTTAHDDTAMEDIGDTEDAKARGSKTAKMKTMAMMPSDDCYHVPLSVGLFEETCLSCKLQVRFIFNTEYERC